jgi:hypothetical protein
LSIPGAISCFRGEDFVQPFAVGEDLTDRALAFVVRDRAGATLFTKTVGVGITVTDALLGLCEVSFASADTDLEPGSYTYALSFGDPGARAMLSHGRFTVYEPRVA